MSDLEVLYEARRRTVRAQLSSFLRAAANCGLPVRFLRHVFNNYSVRSRPGSGLAHVNVWLNSMTLRDDTLRRAGSMSPSAPSREASAIETIYHESTHAYLDLKAGETAVARVLRAAQSYYQQGGRLQGGAPVTDGERVMQEAAAEYVGHRASRYWTALESLTQVQDALDSGPVASRQTLRSHVEQVPREYDAAMAVRVFGYQLPHALSDRQLRTTTRMHNGLRIFCDRHLLENKIPNHFNLARSLMEQHRALLARLAP